MQVTLLRVVPNRAYSLQASADLKSWHTVDTRTAQSGTLDLVDPETGPFIQRFYRAVEAE